MSRLTGLQLPLEIAYQRRVRLALELLDPVTQQRVSQGIQVTALGWSAKPVVNSSGFFVWFESRPETLQKIVIDPGTLPYESIELDAAVIQGDQYTQLLSPRVNYPFPASTIGLRGTLLESRSLLQSPEPVTDAEIRLRWLTESDGWQTAPAASRTDRRSGDFVAFLKLTPHDPPPAPVLDDDGNTIAGLITVRLLVARPDRSDRESDNIKLPAGRLSEADDNNRPWIFAWDELQP